MKQYLFKLGGQLAMEHHREQALDNERTKILLHFFTDTLVGDSRWKTGLKSQVAAEGGVYKLLHLFIGLLDKARKTDFKLKMELWDWKEA